MSKKSGSRLRREREAAHLTQNQLAGLADVNQGSISKLERGHLLSPTFDTLYRLAWALQKVGRKVTPEDLQPGRQPMLIKGLRTLRKYQRSA